VADALAELFAQLAAVRRRRGSTQAQVGAVLGLTGVSIANWEGGRIPSAGNFVLWAEALSQRLAVVDGAGAVRTPPRPVPQVDGEKTHLYRLRVLALTLRNVREFSGALQPEVGALLGVSGWTVQMWENGRRVPRLPRLVTWCEVLGCRLELRERR
jgi:transcriptional regulator with XRE-family HTH domain